MHQWKFPPVSIIIIIRLILLMEAEKTSDT
jgi:hypothetical protein